MWSKQTAAGGLISVRPVEDAMAELKTKPSKNSVSGFLGKVADEKRRNDCQVILKLMAEVTRTSDHESLRWLSRTFGDAKLGLPQITTEVSK